MKNRIKNSRLIGSKAFAELFLQTHHSPSLPLLPGANSIISLTTSSSYEHPLLSSPAFSLSFSSSFLPLSLPLHHSILPLFHSQTVDLNSFCKPPCLISSCISLSLPSHPSGSLSLSNSSFFQLQICLLALLGIICCQSYTACGD